MARVFTKNTSNYLGLGVGGIGTLANGASAIAIHGFAKHTSHVAGDRILATCIDGGSASISMSAGTGFVVTGIARSTTADGAQIVNGNTVLQLGVWASCGVYIDFANATISVYLNGKLDKKAGVTFGASTYTLGTPTVIDTVGCAFSASPSAQIDGSVSQLAVWKFGAGSNGLESADWAALAKGVPFWQVQRGRLIAGFPLNSQTLAGPEKDMIGALSGTINGSIPMAADPVFGGVVNQRRRIVSLSAAAGFLPAWASQANSWISQGAGHA